MTIAISTIEDIVRQWFTDNTTFADTNAIFSKQNAPKPSVPWAELDLQIAYIPVGMYDEQINQSDGTIKISQVRRIPVEINTYGVGALQAVRDAVDSLHLPSVYNFLRGQNGIAVLNRSTIQVTDLTAIEDERYVERGFLSFTIEVFSDVSDDIGYFDQVQINEGVISELKPDDLDPLNQEHPVKVEIELPASPPDLNALRILIENLIINNAGLFVLDDNDNYVVMG